LQAPNNLIGVSTQSTGNQRLAKMMVYPAAASPMLHLCIPVPVMVMALLEVQADLTTATEERIRSTTSTLLRPTRHLLAVMQTSHVDQAPLRCKKTSHADQASTAVTMPLFLSTIKLVMVRVLGTKLVE